MNTNNTGLSSTDSDTVKGYWEQSISTFFSWPVVFVIFFFLLKRETVFVAAGKYTDEKTIISFTMKTKLKSISQVLLNT